MAESIEEGAVPSELVVYEARNKTSMLMFATREAAENFISTMPGSVAGGFHIFAHQVFGTPAVAAPVPTIEPSGETMQQREEVCAAWHALPDDLRKDKRLTPLYHALGGPHMEAPADGVRGPVPSSDSRVGGTEP